MKTRLSAFSLLGFLALMFLITESHDWTHYLTATVVCGGFGSKGFESWTIAAGCIPDKSGIILIGFSGPFLNYFLMWLARYWMRNKSDIATKSRGFLLLAASLPGRRLVAALRGGGDETATFRQVWAGGNQHHHLPALLGLLLVLLFTLPPLIRAFLLLRPGAYRWIVFPAWLTLPGLINEWTISLLNRALSSTLGKSELTSGIPSLVAGWTLICVLLTAICWKHLGRALQA